MKTPSNAIVAGSSNFPGLISSTLVYLNFQLSVKTRFALILKPKRSSWYVKPEVPYRDWVELGIDRRCVQLYPLEYAMPSPNLRALKVGWTWWGPGDKRFFLSTWPRGFGG